MRMGRCWDHAFPQNDRTNSMGRLRDWLAQVACACLVCAFARYLYWDRVETARVILQMAAPVDWLAIVGMSASLFILAEGFVLLLDSTLNPVRRAWGFGSVFIALSSLYMCGYALVECLAMAAEWSIRGWIRPHLTLFDALGPELLLSWDYDWHVLAYSVVPSLSAHLLWRRLHARGVPRTKPEGVQLFMLREVVGGVLAIIMIVSAVFHESLRPSFH